MDKKRKTPDMMLSSGRDKVRESTSWPETLRIRTWRTPQHNELSTSSLLRDERHTMMSLIRVMMTAMIAALAARKLQTKSPVVPN
jgi:hypothetical protein